MDDDIEQNAGRPEFIVTALKRFALCEDAERENRKDGLEADKFSIGDQWPDVVKADRQIDNRPCLVINQIPKFIRDVTNEQRMNRPSIKISPTDDQTIETADVQEGMIRYILNDSHADVAIDTACDSQVTKGFGFFRVLTEYESDESFDQCIKVKQIRNAFTVYIDPRFTEPDASDAEYMFVTSDMDKDEFKKMYPKSQVSALNMETLGDSAPHWMEGETIRVAEYWVVEKTPTDLYLLEDGSVTDKPEGRNTLKKRTVQNKKIKMYKINGLEVLEESEWAGKYIPIVPIFGEDKDIDGKRVIRGMVKDMMDPQRQYNYWSSASTEAIALAPKAPFIMAEGQQTGYEEQWQSANQKNFPYLLYSPITINGQLASPPSRNVAEPPVQAMTMAIRQAAEDMRGTTGIFNDNLGQPSNAISGKAILAKQNQGDVATYHYGDNLKRGIKYLGCILLDLIPKIYDTARQINIIHEDGTHEPVTINQPYQRGNKTVHYDLSKGKYDVVVDIGPSYSTKRQQAADSIEQLAQAYPPILQVAGDILVKNLDWPGAQQVASRLKLMLPPQIKAAVDQEDQAMDNIPPEVKQEIAGMHEVIQKGQAAVQELQQALTSKQGEDANKAAELAIKDKDVRVKAFQAKTDLLKSVPTQSAELDALLQEIDDVIDGVTPEEKMQREQRQNSIQAGMQVQKQQHENNLMQGHAQLQAQKIDHDKQLAGVQAQIEGEKAAQSAIQHQQLMQGLGQIVQVVGELVGEIKKETKAIYDGNGKLIGVKKV